MGSRYQDKGNIMKITRIDFKKKKDIDTLLVNYSDIYSVESCIYSDVAYGISNGKFAIIMPYGVVSVPYDDVEEFAKYLIDEIKDEVLALYEDTKFLFETSKGKWRTKSAELTEFRRNLWGA